MSDGVLPAAPTRASRVGRFRSGRRGRRDAEFAPQELAALSEEVVAERPTPPVLRVMAYEEESASAFGRHRHDCLRARAGMTAAEAARTLGTTQAQVSDIEANRFGVSAERVRTLAHIYGCTDQVLVDALADRAADRTHGWWEEYRETLPSPFLDVAELEHHACALRIAQVINVPGLLQTPEHARALFRQVLPTLPPMRSSTASHTA